MQIFVDADALIENPVIKASICNGEQVAGFKDIYLKEFTDNWQED